MITVQLPVATIYKGAKTLIIGITGVIGYTVLVNSDFPTRKISTKITRSLGTVHQSVPPTLS